MASRFSLILFLLLVVGGGLVIGYLTAPGDWYAQLAKPAFNPPGWVFAPVWTTLYVLIAISGWRVSRRQEGHSTRTSIRLWWIQLALNFLWSPVFFRNAPYRRGSCGFVVSVYDSLGIHNCDLAARSASSISIYSIRDLDRFRRCP